MVNCKVCGVGVYRDQSEFYTEDICYECFAWLLGIMRSNGRREGDKKGYERSKS